MERVFRDGRAYFSKADPVKKLVLINAGVFIGMTLTAVLLKLFDTDGSHLYQMLAFPAHGSTFIKQPWSLLSYMFVHADWLHLLFNMLWLYWFGQLFLDLFGTRNLYGLYLLGGLLGAMCYAASYNIFPYYRPLMISGHLVGASASVMALIVATAMRIPNSEVGLFIAGRVRIKYIAIAVVLCDLLMATSTNSGGHIAHLGGALAGYLFARGMRRGENYTDLVNKPIDALVNLVRKLRCRSARMQVHHGQTAGMAPKKPTNSPHKKTKEINRILDKLRQTGYNSLTEEEKKQLFDAGR